MNCRYVFLFAAAMLLLAGCSGEADDREIRLNGRIEAPSVDLAPRVTGRVVEITVREGDRVKGGALLARLDLGENAIAVDRERAAVRSAQARAEDLQSGSRPAEIATAHAEVAERRAALALAEKERMRQQVLLEQKIGSERDYDRARADRDRAAAAVKASEERLALVSEGFRAGQTRAAQADTERATAQLEQALSIAREGEIRAPADGVILHRLAEPGQLLGPGQPAVTMAFANRLFVRTFIPETKLGLVKMGTPARVTVDAFPGREFPARITEISPEAEFTPKAVETKAERVNLVYAAKADLDRGWAEPLVPGQPAEVVITTAAAPRR